MTQSKKDVLRLAFSNLDVEIDKLYDIIHLKHPESCKDMAVDVCNSCIETLGFISDTFASDDEEK